VPGYHGTVGATGVRPAVGSELRRVLTFAGLLTGALFTVWLVCAAPAHSAELTGPGSALPSGLAEGTEALGGSVTGVVATVGERAADQATRVVDGASEAAHAVEAETAVPVQQVRDAVRETSLPRSEHLPELVAPDPVRVTEPAAEADGDDTSVEAAQTHASTRTEAASEVRESAEQPAADALVAARAQTASVVQETTGASDRGTAGDASPAGADPLTTVAGGTAPATSGSAPAPAVAGFLPVTGAPAPAPGLFEAARHVLRSVPADPADEPTFSPD
jgi:hypothetical protein